MFFFGFFFFGFLVANAVLRGVDLHRKNGELKQQKYQQQ